MIRLSSSFFEESGWTSDQPHYTGTFNPKSHWVAKKRGELRVLFNEESGPVTYKTTIAKMLEHGLTVVDTPTQVFYDDSSAPSSPDESMLVSALGRRPAAAAAAERMAQVSPASTLDSSSPGFSPARCRRTHKCRAAWAIQELACALLLGP